MTVAGIRVSIILPLHNAESYVDSALRSLSSLEGGPFEIVAVNDHSTDATAQLLEEWSTRLPALVVLTAEDRGVSAARNLAVSRASGDYFWFTDCDDSWDPAIVRVLRDTAVDAGADIAICNAEKRDLAGASQGLIEDAPVAETSSGSEVLERLLTGRVQGHLWNKLFRRDLFVAASFPPTRAHSDLGGMFGLFARAATVVYVPQALYDYVLHAGSILNQRAYRWEDLEDCLKLAETAADTIASDGMRRGLTLFKYQNVVVPLENEAIRRGEWEDADSIAAMRRRNRSRIRTGELAYLATHGHRSLAAKSFAIKWLPVAYRALYERHRRRTWSALDSALQ